MKQDKKCFDLFGKDMQKQNRRKKKVLLYKK